MKALQDKNLVLWLVGLLGIVSAIAFYRGFRIPVPAFNEEALTALRGNAPQETQTNPHEAEPRLEQSAVRPYSSEHPLYFRVVFGQESNDSMLGMIDESGGTGTGYNVAYIDENMNGDLADDEPAKRFTRREVGGSRDRIENRFEFTGLLKGEQKTRYTLDIYSLAYKNRQTEPSKDYDLFWSLDINQWNYFFINGKMMLYSSAADALKGKPVRLGSQCAWEINSRSQDSKPVISAGLKDENGCTLRILRKGSEGISPTLTLIQDGQVEAEEKMKFG